MWSAAKLLKDKVPSARTCRSNVGTLHLALAVQLRTARARKEVSPMRNVW